MKKTLLTIFQKTRLKEVLDETSHTDLRFSALATSGSLRGMFGTTGVATGMALLFFLVFLLAPDFLVGLSSLEPAPPDPQLGQASHSSLTSLEESQLTCRQQDRRLTHTFCPEFKRLNGVAEFWKVPILEC